MHFTGSLGPLFRGIKHLIKCTTGALRDTKFVFSCCTYSIKITCVFVDCYSQNSRQDGVDFVEWFGKHAAGIAPRSKDKKNQTRTT